MFYLQRISTESSSESAHPLSLQEISFSFVDARSIEGSFLTCSIIKLPCSAFCQSRKNKKQIFMFLCLHSSFSPLLSLHSYRMHERVKTLIVYIFFRHDWQHQTMAWENCRVSWAENFRIENFLLVGNSSMVIKNVHIMAEPPHSAIIKQTKNMDLQFSPLSIHQSIFPHAFKFNFSLNVFPLPKHNAEANFPCLLNFGAHQATR